MECRYENEIRYYVNSRSDPDSVTFLILDRDRNDIIDTFKISPNPESMSLKDWNTLNEFYMKCVILNREASDFKLYDTLLQDFLNAL